MLTLHKYLYRNWSLYPVIIQKFRHFSLPGFGGIPVYFVLNYFIKNILNDSLNVRASAIAFNFFLALIPALMVLFNLVAYLPTEEVKDDIFIFMQSLMPDEAFRTIETTIEDIISKRRGSLLSFGTLLTMYFASNGVYVLMETFDKKDTRPFWKVRLISLGLSLTLSLMLVVGAAMFIIGRIILTYLFNIGFFEANLIYYALVALKLFVVLCIIYFAIAFLLYFGLRTPLRWKFFSPGAFIATLLTASGSYFFGYYVDNFSQYNKFYGSLGTLIALMILFYLIATVLMIGHDLNQGILAAKDKKQRFDVQKAARHMKQHMKRKSNTDTDKSKVYISQNYPNKYS